VSNLKKKRLAKITEMARSQNDLVETDRRISEFTVGIERLEQQIGILESKDTELQNSRETAKEALRQKIFSLRAHIITEKEKKEEIEMNLEALDKEKSGFSKEIKNLKKKK
jgi:chromosome segregation ATPase